MCSEFRAKGDHFNHSLWNARGLHYLQQYCNVIWITFVIHYNLVSFKSWCRPPWGWRDAETCSSDIRVYVYIERHLLGSWMNSLIYVICLIWALKSHSNRALYWKANKTRRFLCIVNTIKSLHDRWAQSRLLLNFSMLQVRRCTNSITFV